MKKQTTKQEGKKTKKVSKNTKKNEEIFVKIPVITMILAIILVCMIGFVGIYTKKQNRMENSVKDYSYSRDLKGSRVIIMKPTEGSETVVKDSEGKEVEDSSSLTDEEIQEKGYTKEEKPYNEQSELTVENYKKTKEILEKRLKDLGSSDYIVSLNETNGQITVELEENEDTDFIVSNLATVGKFEIVDTDTQEVLMDNGDIKGTKVMYGSTSSSQNGTSVFLDINFNKEGGKKFENVTGTYTNTTSDDTATNSTDENSTDESTTTENTEEQNETTENTENTENTTESTKTAKTITMKIDGQSVMSTSFDKTIKTGKLELTMGNSTTDSKTLKTNAKNANATATILRNGNMPLTYNVETNEYIVSDITAKDMQKFVIVMAIVAFVLLAILVIRYHVNGLLTAIAYLGFIAVYGILVRYANVTVSIEGILGAVIVAILAYVMCNKILGKIKQKMADGEEKAIGKAIKEKYKEFFLRILPICIMAVVFCFMKWTPIISFGMITFWGIALLAVYQVAVTYPLLILQAKGGKKNEAK